jgi:hypothetical protein
MRSQRPLPFCKKLLDEPASDAGKPPATPSRSSRVVELEESTPPSCPQLEPDGDLAPCHGQLPGHQPQVSVP